MTRRIHLIAPAGSVRPMMEALRVSCAAELIARVQGRVGADYRVTGATGLIDAGEDELHGGRDDDAARADDITKALANDEVAAVVALRGGAWLTRVLPRIDFGVLDRRRGPVAVFGFSELTTLVNIVGAHRNGLGVHDMGPGFLPYGLRRHARLRLGLTDLGQVEAFVRKRLWPELAAYFERVVRFLTTGRTGERVTAEVARGRVTEGGTAEFVGGNLTVLPTVIGSRYEAVVRPAGRWLLLEDINEKPERIDRWLAHLKLAGFFEECAGLLLGDFHREDETLTEAVVELLRWHLPEARQVPVLVTAELGHAYPMKPLLLHRAVEMRGVGEQVEIG